MQRTKIEWCDYAVNPVKGYCPLACSYCYARRMYDRFGWDKTIRFDKAAMDAVYLLPKGSKIFVGSTIELFGDWIQHWWMRYILDLCTNWKHYTFIFLTKQPQNLARWSPFPENCHVGVSVTDETDMIRACVGLLYVKAKVRFISFEPLHGDIDGALWPEPSKATRNTFTPDWVIIGSETGNRKGKSPLEQVQGWAREIIKAADEAGVPVFTKDNLHLPEAEQRREWPRR